MQPSELTTSATVPLSQFIFRAMASSIFIVAGFGHLASPGTIIARLESAAFGYVPLALAPAGVHVAAAGVVLLLGGLALMAGFFTRLAALALIGVLVPITLTVQLGPGQTGPLFKNVAILGSLIYFTFNGSHAFSVDNLLRRRRSGRSAAASPAAVVAA